MKNTLYLNGMNSKIRALLMVCFMLSFTAVNAQLSGTKNIPGDYADLAAAITDLNTQGVTAPGVTLNLLAGNPQTTPAGGYTIGGAGTALLTTTSVTAQVIIQGNGNTITAFTPQTVGLLNDGIFKIVGADFITIDNFIMVENAGNTISGTSATNNMTEWGVALVYATTTNGCQDNTIKNCTIDLNRTYQNTFGIYSNSTHAIGSPTTSATATTAAGGNHRLVITGNNITDVNSGIVVVGPTAAADNNDVVTIGASGFGNVITNYGTGVQLSTFANVSGTIYGILLRNSKNYSISYNSITSSNGGVTATSALRGIYVPSFSAAPTGTISNAINNNSISLTGGNAAHSSMHGISTETTTGNATTSIQINNNDFHDWGWTVGAPTGSIIFISDAMANLHNTFNGNTFTNLTIATTGSVTFISNSVTVPAGGSQTANNNSIVTGFNKTGAGGTVILFTSNSASTGTVTQTNSNNNFSNITLTGATTITGWRSTDGGSPVKTVTNNTFSNWNCGSGAVTALAVSFSGAGTVVSGNTISNLTSSGGDMRGIESSSGFQTITGNTVTGLSSSGTGIVSGIAITGSTTAGQIQSVYKNVICNIENSNSAGSVNGILVSSGSTVNLANNIIGDLRTPNANALNPLNGINITATATGLVVNVYYNTVYLNASSTGTDFGSSAISVNTAPSSITFNNNIFVNASSNSGAGIAVAHRRSSTTLTNYGGSSNRNIFFGQAIYADGTNTFVTLGPGGGTYKTFVAPRDANSYFENPPFISTACGNSNFLHVSLSTPTSAESGGASVAGFTDDFDGHIRFGEVGYAGTGTAPDVGADEFDGVVLPQCTTLTSAGSISGDAVVCAGQGTTLTLSGYPTAAGLSFQWYSGLNSGGPYPTPLGTGTSQPTGAIPQTSYFIVTVTCATDGSTASTAQHEVFVQDLPTVSISPGSGSYCNPGGTPVTLTASGTSTSYSWAPSSGLSAVTGSTVDASPAVTTTYTVTGTLNGCTSTATVTVTVFAGTTMNTVTATPANICSGANSQLDANANCLVSSIYITEVTIFRTGTGSTPTYPGYLTGADLVEISNISSSPIDISGYLFHDYASNATSPDHNYTFPSGAIIPPGSVLTLCLGAGTDDPANRHYFAGTPSDGWLSGDVGLFVLKNGSAIVDAVGLNSPVINPATGVTASDWSGSVSSASGVAGVVRTGALDTNTGSDWTSSTVTTQSQGTYNGGYTPPNCAFTYTWSPATFLSSNTGSSVTATGVTSTTSYTVTASTSDGCTASGTVTVFVEPLVCGSLTIGGSTSCAGFRTLTANPSGGGTPYSYAWTENGNPFGGNTQTIITSAGTHTYVVTVTDACSNTCTASLVVTTDPNPSVSISPSTSLICKPDPNAVTLTASGDAVTYNWSPTDGLTPTSGTSVAAYPVNTTVYTVTAIGANGCTNIATATVNINTAPLALTASAFPAAVCSGDPSNLTSFSYVPTSTTVNNYVFLADEAAALDPMTGATTIITAPNEGTPTGVLPIGFSFNFDNVDYTEFSVSPDGFIKLGNVAATLDASNGVSDATNLPKIYPYWDDLHTGVDGSVKMLVTGTAPTRILKIQWETTIPKAAAGNFNATFQAWLYETGNIIEFRYGSMGAATASSSGGITGNIATNYQSITFSTKTASNSAVNNTQIFSPPSGTIFTLAPPSAAISYAWEPAGLVVSPNSQNSATVGLTSTTTFTVTATNGSCSSTATTTVTAGAPLICSDATASSPICSNTNFDVTANHTGGGAPFTYAWSDGVGGVYPNSQTVTANLPAGTYTFTCTVTDNCGDNCVSSVMVTVLAGPTVSVSPTNGQICKPASAGVTLTASGATTYSWSPASGLSDVTSSTVVANPNFSTTYTVIGTDANGCNGSASASINVGVTPVVSASATPSEICTGTTSQLSANAASAVTANNYQFTASTGASLVDMTGATQLIGGQAPVSSGYGDDDIALPNPVAIGFDFVFEGVTYTDIAVSPDGWIRFGNTGTAATEDFGNGVVDATNIPKVYPIWDDLSIGTDGWVKMLVTGSQPNRILVLEWRSTIPRSLTTAANSTFQAWLHEGTGAIDFVYGTMGTASSSSGGITGATATNYLSLTFSTNSASSTTANNSNTVTPASGTIYTFAPPSGITFAWEPSAGLTPSSTDQNPTTPALTSTTTYTVTATQNGCSATATTTVSITPLACQAATSVGPYCSNSDFTVTAHHTGGGAPFTYAWSDGVGGVYPNAATITANLPAGTYTFECTVSDGCGSSCVSSVVVTVNALPSISVVPTSGQICNPGGSSVTLTASGTTNYTWSPAAGLSSTTGSVVTAIPSSTTTYTVTGIDANGCTGTATSMIQVGRYPTMTVTATPPSICSGTFSQLEANADCLLGALLLTEVTHFKTGTGETTPYPAYLTSVPDDHVEISNISNSSINVGGLVYEVWTGTAISRTVTIPANTILPSNGVLIIGVGTGTDDPANLYFNTGGTSPLSSSTAAGHLIKMGSLIIDAVAMTSYSWPVASGVTASDWSGSGLAASGRAGVIRTAAVDNNNVSDWVLSNEPSPIQTIGTYNGGYNAFTCDFTYSWEPAAGLKPNSFVANPETPGLTANTTYTVTVTSSGCSSTGTVTVFVEPLVCQPASVSGFLCANGNFTVTANHTGGGGPYTYAWSDGVGGIYPATASITANLPAGIYSLECTVTDNCGNSCVSSVTVTVNSLPSVAVNPPTGEICNPGGAAVQLTASGGSTYTWSPTTGITPTTGATVSAAPTVNTTYVVTGTDANGCVNTSSSSIQVGVNPSVTASATPFIVCPGSTVQLNSSATVNYTANTYSFSTGTGTLADMTTATTLIGGQAPVGSGYGDDDMALPNPNAIGFSFVFEGVTYTSYAASPDGWVKLGSAGTEDFSNTVTENTNLPKIYPFWDDQNIGTDGHLKVLLSGSSPNQILIFEWKMAVGTTLTNPSTTTYQLWMYEGTNVIEFHYGTMANGLSASVGITGATSTNYHSASWSTGTSSTTTANNSNTTAPASGTVYTYTPPPVSLSFSWQPAAGLTPSSTDPNVVTPVLNTTTVYTVAVTNGFCTATKTVTANVAVVDDNNVCTTDGCDTNTGHATHTPVNVDDGDPCTADGCNSVTGVFHTPICNVTLNSSIYLQGYYTGSGMMDNFGAGGYMFVSGGVFTPPAAQTDVDFVTISAMDPTFPYALVDAQTARLQTNGNISVTFSTSVIPGNSYYLKVNHQVSVETWSVAPVVLSGVVNYPFSTAATQAFAANQAITPDNLYAAIFTGDINQDGAVDGSDFLVLDPEIQNGNGGYTAYDLNGDGAVDGSDFLVLDPNIQNGIGAAIP